MSALILSDMSAIVLRDGLDPPLLSDFLSGTVVYPTMTAIHLVMWIGQSWGVRSALGPVVSPTAGPWTGALMPNGGVFNEAGFVAADWTSLVPLHEEVRETPVTGFIEHAFASAQAAGVDVSGWRIVGRSMCNGGKPLAFFLPGSAWFEGQIKPALTHFAAMEPDCGGITFPLVLGGTDSATGTAKEDFKAGLKALMDGLQEHCDAIWGRPMPIRFLMYPPTRNTMTVSDIVQAHLEMEREDGRAEIVMAPYYNLYKDDDRHWTGPGAKRFGMTGGRAAAMWYRGLEPRACSLVDATRAAGSSTVRLSLRLRTAPARINTADMAATAQNGFKLFAGTTEIVPTGYTPSGSDLLIGIPPGAAVDRITYAIGVAAPGIGSDGYDNGQRGTGNISDSTIETVTIGGVDYSMPNFLTQFDEPVVEVSA